MKCSVDVVEYWGFARLSDAFESMREWLDPNVSKALIVVWTFTKARDGGLFGCTQEKLDQIRHHAIQILLNYSRFDVKGNLAALFWYSCGIHSRTASNSTPISPQHEVYLLLNSGYLVSCGPKDSWEK
jgi:hypothetical protein